jgi:hypothetical protein
VFLTLLVSRPGSDDLTQEERALLTKLVRWKVVGANNFQLAMLGLGFKIRPAVPVPEVQFGNSALSAEHLSFVRDDISSRLQKGQFMVVDKSFAKLIHPISVATKKGSTKLRLIMDERFINFFLPHATFSMDTLSNAVLDLIGKDELLFSFVIPYLCFEFEGKVYACTRLFFGFSLAPLVFTKTVRMLVDLCACYDSATSPPSPPSDHSVSWSRLVGRENTYPYRSRIQPPSDFILWRS